MIKHIELLQSLGLQANSLPANIQEGISIYNESVSDLNKSKQELNTLKGADRKEAEDNIAEIEQALVDADGEIAEEIRTYAATVKPAPAKPSKQPVAADGDDDWGTWLLGGVILIASFGAYNYFKNRG